MEHPIFLPPYRNLRKKIYVTERHNHGIGQNAGILCGERFQDAEVGLSVVCGEDVADMVRTVDQVDFKVSETVLRVGRGGPERNRYAARDGAAPVLQRSSLVVRLETTS